MPTNATSSDTCAPWSTREKTSRPIGSTPNQCSLLGPVGSPKSSSDDVSCTFGGGAPTSFVIGVAKIAHRISSRDEAQSDEGDLVPTEPPPEELHW